MWLLFTARFSERPNDLQTIRCLMCFWVGGVSTIFVFFSSHSVNIGILRIFFSSKYYLDETPISWFPLSFTEFWREFECIISNQYFPPFLTNFNSSLRVVFLVLGQLPDDAQKYDSGKSFFDEISCSALDRKGPTTGVAVSPVIRQPPCLPILTCLNKDGGEKDIWPYPHWIVLLLRRLEIRDGMYIQRRRDSILDSFSKDFSAD